MNKAQHLKWLEKMGVSPQQLSQKKKKLGSPNKIPVYKIHNSVQLSNDIPSNGTKSTDISRAQFSNMNYAMVPAFNKGPIQPMSKKDLSEGAGRKL
jgi:hypothetical protein